MKARILFLDHKWHLYAGGRLIAKRVRLDDIRQVAKNGGYVI